MSALRPASSPFSHRRTTSSASARPPSPPLAHTSDRATFTPSSRHLSSTSFELGLGVGGEAVDGHHARQVVHVRDVLHVLQQVGQAAPRAPRRFSSLSVGLGHAAVVLERADRRHHDDGVGLQAGQAALDVQELLRAQVGAEAGLGDAVVAQRAGPCCVAMMELQPCAMLANGPPCTNAGVPSSVCTRLGLSASLSSAAMAPCGVQVVRR